MPDFVEKSVQLSPDIVVVCDKLGKSLWKNDVAVDNFESEWIRDFFVEAADFDSMLEAKFIGVGDRTHLLRNGWLAHTVAVSVEDQDQYFITFRDIRALDLLTKEEDLRERVKAISGFANNVAFDIATPLTVILGRLGFLYALDGSLGEGVSKQLRIIREHVNRISSTVSNLQIFASLDCEEPKSIDPLALLEGSAARALSYDKSLSINCDFEAGFQSGKHQIQGDQTLLSQALEALMKSVALSSIGGEIYTLTGRCDTTECALFEIQSSRPGRLSDEGWERLESSSTQALGFGVSVAVIIIGYHSGVLYFRETNGSIAFRIRLPLEFSSELPVNDKGPKQRVLFVDDDPALLALGREILELEGHTCECAGTADEALLVLELSQFDLVITDIRLPGMSGLAFREIAEAKWPELQGKFIFVTGLSLQSVAGVRLLQKPFTPQQLIRLVLEASS
mgnify:CR=1 FL=1